MPILTGRPGDRTMEMNGGSSAPYLACTPCVPLFVHCLIRLEAEGLLDYQGRTGDHSHCTVEPSPGHIRCRLNYYNLHRANGRGSFGGQTAGGHPKAFPWPKKSLLAVPALRELESACRVSIL